MGARHAGDVALKSRPMAELIGHTGSMGFWRELRRRRVYRMAGFYVVGAWLVIQVADVFFPAWGLPETALRFLIVAAILCFPIALVFSWTFDISTSGIVKTEPADPGETFDNSLKRADYIVLAALLSIGAAIAYGSLQRIVEEVDVAVAAVAITDNSIAVLPFVNMSSDEEQEYFSDGLSEELLHLLAKIPELSVAARTSSFSFKDKDLGIPEIASRLRVAHILEGSVRKHGNQLRITAQLIRADNGYQLWSETYERRLNNVFQIQEDIARAVADALRITLLGEAPKLQRTDPRVYQLFLEGRFLKRQLSDDSLPRALEVLKQAVEIDPTYSPALTELADTYFWNNNPEDVALADKAIEAAISSDPGYAQAYYVRGASWVYKKNKFKEGIADFEYAYELEPNNADLVAAIGKGALVAGNFDLAITQMQAALALEIVPEFYFHLGRAYLISGRLDEAEASFRRMMDLAPDSPARGQLWETLLVKGDLDAALPLADSEYQRAVTYFALGDTAKADEILDLLIERILYWPLALAYGYRGDTDKTFEWLDYMLANSDHFPTFILSEPAFRSVHSDPRWEHFLEKLGLLEYWHEMTPD